MNANTDKDKKVWQYNNAGDALRPNGLKFTYTPFLLKDMNQAFTLFFYISKKKLYVVCFVLELVRQLW